MRSSVVLPLPLAPVTISASPEPNANATFANNVTPPRCAARRSALNIGKNAPRIRVSDYSVRTRVGLSSYRLAPRHASPSPVRDGCASVARVPGRRGQSRFPARRPDYREGRVPEVEIAFSALADAHSSQKLNAKSRSLRNVLHRAARAGLGWREQVCRKVRLR